MLIRNFYDMIYKSQYYNLRRCERYNTDKKIKGEILNVLSCYEKNDGRPYGYV